jgi:large subunit ribosomal protein L30
MDKKIKVTLKKSLNGRLASHQACARGLGLKKLNNSAVVADTPENRGMISRISYLVAVEDA